MSFVLAGWPPAQNGIEATTEPAATSTAGTVAATTTVPSRPVDPTTGRGAEFGKAAPIGLLIVVLLCIAGYFLARSMSKHLKKVPKSFDPVPPGPTVQTSQPERKRTGSDGS